MAFDGTVDSAFDASPEAVLTSAAQGRLRSIMERVANIQEERDAALAAQHEVYAEAKNEGYDVKILRKIARLLKQDKAKRQEEDALLGLYLSALGEV